VVIVSVSINYIFTGKSVIFSSVRMPVLQTDMMDQYLQPIPLTSFYITVIRHKSSILLVGYLKPQRNTNIISNFFRL